MDPCVYNVNSTCCGNVVNDCRSFNVEYCGSSESCRKLNSSHRVTQKSVSPFEESLQEQKMHDNYLD